MPKRQPEQLNLEPQPISLETGFEDSTSAEIRDIEENLIKSLSAAGFRITRKGHSLRFQDQQGTATFLKWRVSGARGIRITAEGDELRESISQLLSDIVPDDDGNEVVDTYTLGYTLRPKVLTQG